MLINQSFVSKSAIQSWRPRLFLSVNMWALLAFRNAFLHWVSRPRPEYWRGENRSTNSQARFLLPWPIYADKISDKGLPYMTSARFSDILTPSPLVTVTNQLVLFLSSAFWGPPPPSTADVIYGRPPTLMDWAWPCEENVENVARLCISINYSWNHKRVLFLVSYATFVGWLIKIRQ